MIDLFILMLGSSVLTAGCPVWLKSLKFRPLHVLKKQFKKKKKSYFVK